MEAEANIHRYTLNCTLEPSCRERGMKIKGVSTRLVKPRNSWPEEGGAHGPQTAVWEASTGLNQTPEHGCQ
ncbi:hypothetical protein I79_007568 [Cricetulus griseus]|uniref:Uncharacterized protein n=1 Tax=Cricetulus griseus TaxID=10029 RepID=G3HAV9_CRIGR|nr:hypothetical protein I79_007568 [Cricetulus griseus]